MKYKNPFEALLDENCNDNIVFTNDKGEKIEFEQYALINLNNDQYAILRPINLGLDDDILIAYNIYVEGNNYELIEVEDDDLLEEIYEEYKKLSKNK